MAAVLACAPAAFLSHLSAGRVWELTLHTPRPTRPEVTVVRRDPRRPGVRIHRVRSLDRAETATRHRIPITNPARTLLDLAATLPPRRLEQALAQALRQRLTCQDDLATLLARRSPRPGAPKLRRLLAAELAFTRSELEELFLAVVREAGLPEPDLNAKLGPYEVDFPWRTECLVVELDGWTWHSDRKAFEDDRRRDADLVARGYRVIRVTWRQLRDEPLAVAARVAVALAA
jgi:very-short-patch-repair endonuclease